MVRHWRPSDSLSNKICTDGPLADPLVESQFEEILLGLGLEKVTNWEYLFVHRNQGLFFSENVDDITMVGRRQNMDRIWKKKSKLVDLDEPTSFSWSRKCWDALNVNANLLKQLLNSTQRCSNHSFLLEQLKNCQGGRNLTPRRLTWSYDIEGPAKKFVERLCELANKKTEQQYKVSTPCLDDHHFKKEWTGISWRTVNSMLTDRLKKACILARIGRPDMLWSVNKLARAVSKWTRACDRRLARLISCVHHTSTFRRYCHVGSTAQHCRLGWSQDSDFAGDLKGLKNQLRVNLLYFWKSNTCSP